jgi:Nucleotidyltransferase of unknown function (DUF6036)
MTEFPLEWLELFDSLRSNRVRYLIVGGYALAANASPRRTDDIDIFVEPTLENARRLGDALRDYGYPALATAWRKFAQRDRMATIGIERTLPFLGLEALLINKRSSARLKDLADVAKLTGESEEELIRHAAAQLAARSDPAKKRPASKSRSKKRPTKPAKKSPARKRSR